MRHLKWKVTTKLIALTTVLMLVLSGVLMAVSYIQQIKDYQRKLKATEKVVGLMWEHEVLLLTKVMEQIKKGDQSEAAKKDREQIISIADHFVKDSDVSNIVLYYPEENVTDGKTTLKVIGSNSKLAAEPLMDYPLSEEYGKAYEGMKKEGQGISTVYKDEAGQWISIMSIIDDPSGQPAAYVGIDFDFKDGYEELTFRFWMSLGISLGIGLLFIVMLSLFVRKLLKPVGELSRLSLEVAQGDLTVSIPVRSQDEFGTLAHNFNMMTASIRELITGIRDSSEEVGHASEVLKTSANQTTEATHHIAGSIEQVAAGAERQMQSTQESTIAMEEMASGIQRIAESAGSVAQSSESAAEEASRGNVLIQRNVAQMSHMNETVQSSMESVNQLTGLSEQIGNITSMIADIAKQTNLLALNAAIEAARAGEHGKGFSVVSDEIRKLAEQSKQSSEQISDLVVTIRSGTGKAVGMMKRTAEEVTEMTQVVAESGEAFQRIVDHMDELAKQILEVSSSSQQMSAGTEEVAASISELSSMNRQAFDSAQTVAASSEEQLASMEDISASANVLNEMAQELRLSVSRFKL
ncbi:methyl-accepting chemotaxis protein [Paenibacillus lutrae]|uniref:HAMP domain-containing protein n=1 Tax=Paenibacillus lutrae TaxID=2078573 RepID=A0A7X3FKL2_9BACL|nr:methyl-accepting chemotaxis protein [Paenibacillus lutrae]MVP01438.1 HAMP domain-containing protein [Paenibacillus lutrae]